MIQEIMKRILATTLLLTMALTAFAQKFDFPIGKDGVCVVSGTESTQLPPEMAYEKVKAATVSQMNISSLTEDRQKGSFSFVGSITIYSDYNAFTGQYIKNLLFEGTFRIVKGTFTYSITDLQIEETYYGYGEKHEVRQVSDYVDRYYATGKAIEDAKNSHSLSKKQRRRVVREAKDKRDNIEDILTKASDELSNRLWIIKNTLK